MNKLGDRFPNFIIAMSNISDGTDTILIENGTKHIFYKMTLMLFGKKAADMTYELDSYNSGVIFKICTNKGFSEKAKTSSKLIQEDLSIDEWVKLISEMVIQHNNNPSHIEFLFEQNRKKIATNDNSGCLLMLLPIIIITVCFMLIL